MTDTVENASVSALEEVATQVQALAEQVNTLPAPTPQGDATGATGEWTTSEILGHLCDSARLWGGRMRRIVYEANPSLPVFDENEQVQLAAYRYKPAAPLLQEFLLLSKGNTTFLRSMTPEQWQRAGVHSERGSVTLREVVSIEAGHERGHLAQLEQSLSGENAGA